LVSPPDEQVINLIDSSFAPSTIIPDVPSTGELPVTPMPISPPFTDTDSPTPIITIVGSPVPVNVESNNINDINEGDEQVITSTPKPKDNNGNHYGQTPKPERQKATKSKDEPNQASKDKSSQASKNK